MPPAAPQYHPTPVELDDLELLTSGVLAPLTSVNRPGSLITLTLPEPVAAVAEAAGGVEIVDPEGLPLARVAWPSGEVEALTHAQYGPFRGLMVGPADYRSAYGGRTVVPVADALRSDQLERLAELGPVTLLALVGTGTPSLSPVALIRASRAAAALLPDAVVVTVPLASHGQPDADRRLREQVIAAFAAGDAVVDIAGLSPGFETVAAQPPQPPGDAAQPPQPPGDAASVAEEVAQRPSRSLRTLDGYPPGIARIVEQDQPPPERRGLVLFFTGLSGSGKSTLARALVDRLLEQGSRTVTSLDGDVVRRNLSAGLTFSREDRETNIRRIGWVAAEIARHGGVAAVSPIAPFDETRQQVRAMVRDAGGAFFLVHVATPLAECERRDRKGLYAKARAGEIPEFTGISSPYEEPADADVRVDTTGRTINDALGDVLIALATSGFLQLRSDGAVA